MIKFLDLILHLLPHAQVIIPSSMGNIPLHANFRNVRFELINIIEPVTSWLDGQLLFFFYFFCIVLTTVDGMLYLVTITLTFLSIVKARSVTKNIFCQCIFRCLF